MDIVNTYKRSEVNKDYTWDLTSFFKTEEDFDKFLPSLEIQVGDFVKNYEGRLNNKEVINESLKDFRKILEGLTRCGSYQHLKVAVDNTNTENMGKYMAVQNTLNSLRTSLSFYEGELLANDEKLLKDTIKLNPENKTFLEKLIEEKPTILSKEVESILSSFSMTFGSFQRIYNASKLQDMDFPNFKANGKEHKLSYNIYEGLMENNPDIEMRRNSFRVFSDKLEEYKNLTASTYLAHVQTEKTLASLKGFDSVIDYLLFQQRVPRELYNRQIDIIMEELSPVMRKYARLLKEKHKLSEIRYEDLKIELDPEFSKEISVEEAKVMLLDGLSILGEDYTNMIERAFDERWIDFVNNTGKSTGAFCSSPYGVHPYILISWTGTMTETMVLGHELGHAGHFFLNQKEQNILDTRPSTYFIEAPSTTNELIMANYLVENAKTERERKYYKSQIISRTYYHNFVTHLLEAAYQREVYNLIDEGKSFSADTLSNIYLDILQKFWGDDVVLTKGAELTWMRQPHYYMGLYPYTYSAGLTIGTEVSQNILKEGKPAASRWLDTLKLGGTMDSVGLAKNAGVDITSEEPLRNTIKYIDSIVEGLK